MAGRPVFLAHPSSLDHDPGPHPEQPARISAIEQELSQQDWVGYERVASTPVPREVLERVHPPAQVERIAQLCARGGGHIDMDTAVSTGSFTAALHAAGGAVQLAQMLARGDVTTGFSAHRPPGHHALATRSMGFCLFNSVAVASRYAVTELGLDRVMIVDWDVHHGNGTEAIFWESDSVLFISLHQSPLYPGTGAAEDLGAGRGTGYTINLPVPPGSGDSIYLALVDGVITPVARAFEPQLLLISAGYDAHHEDPLADCMVSDAGFAAMAARLADLGSSAGVPVGALLEGGYALGPLARSVAATMSALAAPEVGRPQGHESTSAGERLVERAQERLRPWWDL